MPTNHLKRSLLGVSVLAAMALAGCANQPKSLYGWNGYEAEVYAYLKNDSTSPDEQIAAMEKGLQEAAGKGEKLPPGYQAHLGLLYLNTGHADKAVAAWEQEKRQFPESRQYVDYLLANMKKNGG